MTTGGRSTPSIRGIEKPHTSASTTADGVAPLGQGHGQVGGDRRLADAALARGDQQAPGAATTGRRRGWPGPRRGRGPAWVPAVAAGSPCSLLAQRGALLVGHDGEVDADRRRRRRAPTTASVTRSLDLVAQRAAGDGQGDLHLRRAAPSMRDVAHHVEIDDAAVQLGVLDRAQGLDDLGLGDGHAGVLAGHGRLLGRRSGYGISPTADRYNTERGSGRHSRPPSSPRRSPPSPPPSATRPGARSTSSPASTPTGVTAAEVAERFDLHPNVARHHLDKLAGGGYLEVAVARSGRRRRRSAVEALPGRPSRLGRHRVRRCATTTCSSPCSAGRWP